MDFNTQYTSYPPPPSSHHYDTDYKPVGSTPEEHSVHDDGLKKERKMEGKWLEIACCFMIMTIPMLFFSCLLLGLIFSNQITQKDFVSERLRFTTAQFSSDAVYVNMSSTLLVTIASWASSVAPILVGFAVTLLSYPVGKGLMAASALNQPDKLPTPYQLALMIRMNSSTAVNSLFHWCRYRLFFTKGRNKQPSALTSMTTVIIISWLLSVFVFVTDTWLHIATKSVNVVQVSASQDFQNLTFALNNGCTTSNNSYTNALKQGNACAINPTNSVVTVLGSSDVLRTLNNVSDSRTVKTVVADGKTYLYMGNSDQSRLANLDYTATTYAIHTQCRPVTSRCVNTDNFAGSSTPYECPFAFSGDLAQDPWTMSFYSDSSFADNDTIYGIENPYYFALAASQNQNVGQVNQVLSQDSEIAISTHGASVFILTCESTLFDVEYSSVNGSITRWVTKLSDSSVANMVQGPQAFTNVGNNYLQQATSLAMFSNTAEELAEEFAQAFGRNSMALVAGALTSVPGLEAQSRASVIAARVPYAPLIASILANLFTVVLGIVLTVMAVLSAAGDTVEAQARLNIQAIVAQCFEGGRARRGVKSPEAMFDEYAGKKGQKIGVIRAEEGGWAFATWRPAN